MHTPARCGTACHRCWHLGTDTNSGSSRRAPSQAGGSLKTGYLRLIRPIHELIYQRLVYFASGKNVWIPATLQSSHSVPWLDLWLMEDLTRAQPSFAESPEGRQKNRNEKSYIFNLKAMGSTGPPQFSFTSSHSVIWASTRFGFS